MRPLAKRTALLVDLSLAAALIGAAYWGLRALEQSPQSPWDWAGVSQAFAFREPGKPGFTPGPLGIGLINTLRLAAYSACLACLTGLGIALLRASSKRPLRMIGSVCVACIRNIPPLVFIFIIHFFLSGRLSQVIQWEHLSSLPFNAFLLPPSGQIPVFFSAIIALSLYEGAYAAEIIRAGIASVPLAQIEAAASLGLNSWQRLRLIIFPQALKFIIPPLTGQGASLIKDSAIVSVIAVQELTFQATEIIASTGLSGEIWLAVTLVYLLLCLALSAGGKYVELKQKG